MNRYVFDALADGLKKEDSIWPLQIVQDVLSLNPCVPLRIYDSYSGENILKHIQENYQLDEFDSTFTLREYISLESKILKKLESESNLNWLINNTPWVTRVSFPHPLFESLLHWKTWKVWDLLHFMFSVRGSKYIQTPIVSRYFPDLPFIYGRISIVLAGRTYTLVCGPLVECGEPGGLLCDQELIDYVEESLKDILYNAPRWTYYALSTNLASRPGVSQKVLTQTLITLQKAFNIIGNIKFVDGYESLERRTLALLARLAYTISDSNDDQRFLNMNKKYPLEIVQRREDSKIYLNYSRSNEWLINCHRLINSVLIKDTKDPLVLKSLANERALEILRQEQFFEKIYKLRINLNRKFGIVATNIENDFKDLGGTSNELCQDVAYLMNADVVNILFYNFSSDSLELQTSYSRSDGNLWSKEVSELFFDRNESLCKEDSICYRAFHNEKPCFTRSFDPEKNVSDSGDGKVLKTSESVRQIKSSIAIPLRAHGRVFGVVEIAGYDKYQFGQSDLRYAGMITESVSHFLYQRYALDRLKNLTTNLLDGSSTVESKYSTMCNVTSEIFGAYGATYWKPDQYKYTHYFPAGNSESRSCLFDNDSNCSGDVRININNVDTVIGYCSDRFKTNNKKYVSFSLNEFSRSGSLSDWVSKGKHRLWLIDNDITSVTAIPFYHKASVRDPDILPSGILVLYFKETNGGYIHKHKRMALTDEWRPTAEFFIDQLRILTDLMSSQEEKEKNLVRIINHEVKQKTDSIAFQANNIISYCGSCRRNRGFRVKTWVDDIKLNCLNLQELQGLLQSDFSWESLLSSDINPITYLIQKKMETRKTDWINLRYRYNEAYRTLWRVRRDKRLLENDMTKSSDWFEVKAHPDNITTILKNLLTNAVKYALENTKVTTTIIKKRYGTELKISNYCRPIQKEELNHIFKNGYQGSNATDVDGEGDGYGLFFSNHICRLYGFDLTAEIVNDEQFNGARQLFTITLSVPNTLIRRGR